MKTIRWIVVAAACLMMAGLTVAQSVDAYLGLGTLITKASPLAQFGVPKLGGGAYFNAGGDIIFLPHNLGLGAQVQWRASQMDYFGQGLRPVFYTFNLAWEPVPTGVSLRPDFNIGFGAENLRVYSGGYTCGVFSCSNHTSDNHLVLHAGVGLKIYWGEHLFLRPGVDYYNIRHNFSNTGPDFEIPAAWQAGISIGYTLGPSS